MEEGKALDFRPSLYPCKHRQELYNPKRDMGKREYWSYKCGRKPVRFRDAYQAENRGHVGLTGYAPALFSIPVSVVLTGIIRRSMSGQILRFIIRKSYSVCKFSQN